MIFSNTPVSICIATYNGSQYISQQLNTILPQLRPFDEVIIVDDCSTDDTRKTIRQINDERIKLFTNKFNQGHSMSFQRALSLTTSEVIYLCDQDDIWTSNRVEVLFNILNSSSSSLLVSSYQDFSLHPDNVTRTWRLPVFINPNLIQSFGLFISSLLGRYRLYGCTFVFKRNLLSIALPIPSYINQHDYWLVLIAILNCTCSFSSFISLYHRIHRNNVTPSKRRPLLKILYTRILLIFALFYHSLKRLLTISP